MLRQTRTWALLFLFAWPTTATWAGDGLTRPWLQPHSRVADAYHHPQAIYERRIYVTYGGNIVYRFPNYDLRIKNYSDSVIAGDQRGSLHRPQSSIVFRNSELGMYWDGGRLIITPNYPIRLLMANRYTQHIIHESEMAWPWLETDGLRVEIEVVPDYPRPLGYRSLSDHGPGAEYFGPQHGPVVEQPVYAPPGSGLPFLEAEPPGLKFPMK